MNLRESKEGHMIELAGRKRKGIIISEIRKMNMCFFGFSNFFSQGTK